ncbi:MAG TPA: CBS domain-containing protein, partial [Ktedonosporobacter sp.]|nr:CBS domain-containing protein [Ktedonosporobacter sp.]
EVILIMEQSAEKLHKMLQEMILYKHIVLTININGSQEYNYSIKPELPTLLKEVSKYPNFTFLALLGKRETLIGYLPARQALQTIVSQENMKDKSVTLVEALGYGLIRELLEYGLIQEKVNCKESNISALKKMTEQKKNLLIVVDDNGKIQGVVEREQVLSKLMLALTAQ